MKAPLTTAYAAILCCVAILSFFHLEYNWDMLPYEALALSCDNVKPDSAHTLAYSTAQNIMPPSKFQTLTDNSNTYRSRAFTSSGFFASQLPLYAIKPLYVAAVYGFYKIGFSLPEATAMPNVVSYPLIGLTLLFWMRRIMPDPYAALISLAAMAAPFLLPLARWSTPDLLQTLLLVFGAFLVLVKGSPNAGIFMTGLAALVRPDAALFAIALGIYAFRFRLLSGVRAWVLIGGTAALTAFVVIRSNVTSADLLLIRSGFDRVSGTPDATAILLYLKGLKVGIAQIDHSSISVALGAAVLTLFARSKMTKDVWNDRTCMLVIVLLAHMVIRFLLHPSVEDRFFLPDYLVLGILLSSSLNESLRATHSQAPVPS